MGPGRVRRVPGGLGRRKRDEEGREDQEEEEGRGGPGDQEEEGRGGPVYPGGGRAGYTLPGTLPCRTVGLYTLPGPVVGAPPSLRDHEPADVPAVYTN